MVPRFELGEIGAHPSSEIGYLIFVTISKFIFKEDLFPSRKYACHSLDDSCFIFFHVRTLFWATIEYKYHGSVRHSYSIRPPSLPPFAWNYFKFQEMRSTQIKDASKLQIFCN